jgi:hypothetical protein
MDEEKAASSEQGQAPETQVQEQPEETKVDFEARYKELESEHSRLAEKAKENEQLIELMTPHTDWNALQGGQDPAKAAPDSGDGDQLISKKAHDEALRAERVRTESQLLSIQFRTDHPELRPYENTLVTPEIVRLRQANPRMSASEVLEKAATFATNFLKAERDRATTELKQQEDAKAAEAAKASGLGSAGTSAPPKDEPVGESAQEYFARRKAQSMKNRGLI